MRATIAKRFTFDAAHSIPGLPIGHKCARLHGHTYVVELVVFGVVDQFGFVMDYADIEAVWYAKVERLIDHQHLNDIPGLERPSTEVLAHWIFHRLIEANSPLQHLLQVVRVKESTTTWCEVARGELDR
jgi:6-pyruvoyltetrahydropterin/6-carboxytetrahydropterin synthase